MRRPNDSAIAIGYIRCSTDEQHLGPEAQREALARWCKANGAELVAVFEDLGVSGGAELDKRPGLLAALEALKVHGAGRLLVAKRDRLARDVVLAAMVERLAEKAGAKVLAADGTGNQEGPEGLLMRGIVDVFAQYERALIRTRTCAALAVKRGRGECIGKVPFGFRCAADGVHLEADPSEQAVLAHIVALRAEGLTIRAIAARLDAERTPTRGNRWHPTTVARVLSRAVA
jgi:DNA invertase Pin-like site-specific DNA recombinase